VITSRNPGPAQAVLRVVDGPGGVRDGRHPQNN
jgi:hypothetical protein